MKKYEVQFEFVLSSSGLKAFEKGIELGVSAGTIFDITDLGNETVEITYYSPPQEVGPRDSAVLATNYIVTDQVIRFVKSLSLAQPPSCKILLYYDTFTTIIEFPLEFLALLSEHGIALQLVTLPTRFPSAGGKQENEKKEIVEHDN